VLLRTIKRTDEICSVARFGPHFVVVAGGVDDGVEDGRVSLRSGPSCCLGDTKDFPDGHETNQEEFNWDFNQ